MSTFEKVRDITVEQLSVDADEVKMESSFIDDLGADSLDIVELIMAFEEEFEVEIPDEKAEKIRTVADQSKCWMKKNNLLAAKGKLLGAFPDSCSSPEMGDIC